MKPLTSRLGGCLKKSQVILCGNDSCVPQVGRQSGQSSLHIDAYTVPAQECMDRKGEPEIVDPWSPALRANIAETLLVPLITEQGGKEIQHEENQDILSGAVGSAQ